jgi:hypothetical protein
LRQVGAGNLVFKAGWVGRRLHPWRTFTQSWSLWLLWDCHPDASLFQKT